MQTMMPYSMLEVTLRVMTLALVAWRSTRAILDGAMVMQGTASAMTMAGRCEHWMIPVTPNADTQRAQVNELLTVALHEAKMVMDLLGASEEQGTMSMACVEA